MDREKLIKRLKLDKEATDAQIIAALDKETKEIGADLDKKIEAAQKKTVAAMSTALEGQGLTLQIDGENVKIEKAAAPPDETAAEKVVKTRLASLEMRESKLLISQAEATVDEAIKAGQLPPGEKERVVKLLSLKEKAVGLMLSGSDPVATALDVVEEVGALLKALPKKIQGSKLSQMETLPPLNEEDEKKRKTALARGKAAIERRKGKKAKKPEPAEATT